MPTSYRILMLKTIPETMDPRKATRKVLFKFSQFDGQHRYGLAKVTPLFGQVPHLFGN